MKYAEKLWTLKERAYDGARRALDDVLSAGPGTAGWHDGLARYDGLVMVRDILTREADRAWDERRVQR